MKIHGNLDLRGTANFAPARARLTTSNFTHTTTQTIVPEIGQTFPGRVDGTNSFRVTVSLNFGAASGGSDTLVSLVAHVGTAGTIADAAAFAWEHVVHGTLETTMSITFMLVGTNFPGNENNVRLSISTDMLAGTSVTTRELSGNSLAQTIIELLP